MPAEAVQGHFGLQGCRNGLAGISFGLELSGAPVDDKIGKSYLARKALFAKGIKKGRLSVQEIETALPAGALTAPERWLLYYSLRAAMVEIVDEVTGQVDHGFLPLHEAAAGH